MEIDGQKLQLCITKPQLVNGSEPKKDAVVQAYFWLGSTSEKSSVNMATRIVQHKGYKIPILYNTRDINQKESLLFFVAKKSATSSIAAPPAKKLKKSSK